MLGNAETNASDAIQKWGLESSITGTISAVMLNMADDVSLIDLLRELLDINSGFNELFVEDRADEVVLVARPTPYKSVQSYIDRAAEFIQPGAWANSVDISSDDVVSIRTHRTDQNTANYFWINSNKMSNFNQDVQALALAGPPGSYSSFDYHNSHLEIHGFREMQEDIALGAITATQGDALKEAELNVEVGSEIDFLVEKREALKKINQDNLIFESATIVCRGNPDLKPGNFIGLNRGVNGTFVGEGYCFEVRHSFIPFHGFTSSCVIDRWSGFIERSRSAESLYIKEIEAGIS